MKKRLVLLLTAVLLLSACSRKSGNNAAPAPETSAAPEISAAAAEPAQAAAENAKSSAAVQTAAVPETSVSVTKTEASDLENVVNRLIEAEHGDKASGSVLKMELSMALSAEGMTLDLGIDSKLDIRSDKDMQTMTDGYCNISFFGTTLEQPVRSYVVKEGDGWKSYTLMQDTALTENSGTEPPAETWISAGIPAPVDSDKEIYKNILYDKDAKLSEGRFGDKEAYIITTLLDPSKLMDQNADLLDSAGLASEGLTFASDIYVDKKTYRMLAIEMDAAESMQEYLLQEEAEKYKAENGKDPGEEELKAMSDAMKIEAFIISIENTSWDKIPAITVPEEVKASAQNAGL